MGIQPSRDQVHTLLVGPDAKAVLNQVEARRDFARKWWMRNTVPNDIMRTTAWVLDAAVPFGLGAVLWHREWAGGLTIAVLGVSLLALALHTIVHSMRFRDKAFHHRKIYNSLEAALAHYRAGNIALAELAARYTEALVADRDEPIT
jgi:hypothetical protein